MRRFLRKKKGGPVLPWTPALAARDDMLECDLKGKEIIPPQPEDAPLPPGGLQLPTGDSAPAGGNEKNPSPDEGGADLSAQVKAINEADIDGLRAMAASMGVKVHHNAKIETIRESLIEAVKKAAAGQGA